MRAVALLLALFALAGCGQTATDKAAKNLSASLDRLAMEQAYGAMLKDADNHPARLTVDLNRYGRSARAYAADVGNDKAARKLADDASSIAPLCPDCADWIDRIRETL